MNDNLSFYKNSRLEAFVSTNYLEQLAKLALQNYANFNANNGKVIAKIHNRNCDFFIYINPSPAKMTLNSIREIQEKVNLSVKQSLGFYPLNVNVVVRSES